MTKTGLLIKACVYYVTGTKTRQVCPVPRLWPV